jgi:hypothetical protein
MPLIVLISLDVASIACVCLRVPEMDKPVLMHIQVAPNKQTRIDER